MWLRVYFELAPNERGSGRFGVDGSPISTVEKAYAK